MREGQIMIRRLSLFLLALVIVALTGCATIAGGLIGSGVGLATGHPVSGALIGAGVGMAIDTAPRK